MISSLTFRQKIFLSYLASFLFFALLLFPVVFALTKRVEEKNLRKKSEQLMREVRKAKSLPEMIYELKHNEHALFFRVTLFNAEGSVLYESVENVAVEKMEQEKSTVAPEVEEAMRHGFGYETRFSPIYNETMAYAAVLFRFGGERYVLRTATPYAEQEQLRTDFLTASFILTLSALLLFSFLTSTIVHYLTRPVKDIISAIKSYRGGTEERLPEIHLGGGGDEFGQLADTLNFLSRRIEHQISKVTSEKNEKAAILESLGEGVIAVGHAMNVTYINHTAELFLDLKKEELLGKSLLSAGQQLLHDVVQEAQKKKEISLAVLQLEKPPRRCLDAIAVPRGREGAIVVIQDKTGLHKLVERGRDFIANASHELKTPITIIQGFAETLHDHPNLSEEVTLEITAKIVSNCKRMGTLVKNLLTLAAIDEGIPSSRLTPCDLEDIASQARTTILSIHPAAKIEISSMGTIPPILADGDLLFQAILNLLDNAVKYSPSPADITVTFEQKATNIIIQISDKGIGISPEDVERVFERFYAVDKSHSRSMGGSGLGLSIVERIIERHGGTASVTSILGHGSTFTLTLPIRTEELSD